MSIMDIWLLGICLLVSHQLLLSLLWILSTQGAYLGVARASEAEPKFIHLTYTPKDNVVNKRVGVIGKGLLFDTGE